MKILYITPQDNRKDYSDDGKEYDFKHISTVIANGILEKFSDIEIEFSNDLHDKSGSISEDQFNAFDLCLCDTTTTSANVSFLAGKAEALNKPIIYLLSHGSRFVPVLRGEHTLTYSEATLEKEFIDELNERINEAKSNPGSVKSSRKKAISKPKAFISYSHNDSTYLNRLMVHLKPLERKGIINIWQDRKIKTGDKWQEKIEDALTQSNIAILLISADFMASDFIVENELPPLLSKAEVKGTKILPVILSHCRFSREDSLNRFQAANSPDNPLSIMSESEREEVYDQIASDIEEALSNS